MKPPRQISTSEATPSGAVPRRSALKLLGGALALPLLAETTTRAAEKNLVWKTAIGLNGFQSETRKYHKNYPIWEVLDPYDACLKCQRVVEEIGRS
jgi:hypothetical protein